MKYYILFFFLLFSALHSAGQFGQRMFASQNRTTAATVQPNSIANLTGWWKPDAGVTLSGSLVSQWASQHGGTNNITPYIYENTDQGGTWTTGGLGGYGRLVFDGVNDGMVSSANPIGDADDATIFIVGNLNVNRGLDGSGNGWSIGISSAGLSHVLVSGGAAGYNVSHTTASNSAIGIYVGTIDQNSPTNTTSTFYDQSTQQATRTDNKYTLRSSGINFALGKSGTKTAFASGSIYELIVYNRLLTSTERGQVVAYLKTKYGL